MKLTEKDETYFYRIQDRLGRTQTVQIIFVNGKYRTYGYQLSDDINADIKNLKKIKEEIERIREIKNEN